LGSILSKKIINMDTHWSEIVKNLTESAAILVGGIWTIYRFGLSRERYPKLQLDIDVSLIGIHHDEYIIELCATVENKGLARQRIKDFRFDLRALMLDTPINMDNEWINNQLQFSRTIILDKDWVPQNGNNNWYAAFIDGGITQKYTYVTSVSKEITYLLFYTRFSPRSLGPRKDVKKDLIPGEGLNKLKRGDFYHVQKVFRVEKLLEIKGEEENKKT
jgi:hypothetical protein